jgi:NADH-quinone oxidoreductase subunit L
MMELLLHFFILLPLAGFILTILLSSRNENAISNVTYITVGLHLILTQVFVVMWLFQGTPDINVKDLVLFKTAGYEYFLDFCFDRITAMYLFVGSLLTFLVTIYSRYYLHREIGYKRFFNTIHFFFLGYNIVIFAGNLETLFIGWEILGISSFLLIAFYRDRYLPVKNAMKVFSIYRLGDVGIIIAMWLSHHLWHENITFFRLHNYSLVHEHLQTHSLVGIFISLAILISAAAKSAQLPFSSWLPRAMEGPTPSSAIFYGSLSVHLGAFLLLRTFPLWEHQISVRILIGVLGLLTSVVATFIARVQSSVKSQIAYASVSQIGIIFIEIAAGFELLALIHFAGNAFMRTYQLLVSPSVVTYLIREQFYNFTPRQHTFEDSFPKRLEYTIYMLSLKEWNLDSFLYRYLWYPMKWAGKRFRFVGVKTFLLISVPSYLIVLFVFVMNKDVVTWGHEFLAPVIAGMGLLLVLRSFTERKNVFIAWGLVILNHFWVALAISFNESFEFSQTMLYMSGILFSGVLGVICLQQILIIDHTVDLNMFHGYSKPHPILAFVFLIACLGLAGFPITPTFIGEDLIFSHIHENQFVLAVLIALSFIIDGLAIIRIYARVFLGPYKSLYSKSL